MIEIFPCVAFLICARTVCEVTIPESVLKSSSDSAELVDLTKWGVSLTLFSLFVNRLLFHCEQDSMLEKPKLIGGDELVLKSD